MPKYGGKQNFSLGRFPEVITCRLNKKSNLSSLGLSAQGENNKSQFTLSPNQSSKSNQVKSRYMLCIKSRKPPENLFFFVKKNKLPKYGGKQNFSLGNFSEVGEKQKM